MKLEQLVTSATLGLAALTLASIGAFVGVATVMHRASRELSATLQSVRAAEELQANLARSNRASVLLAVTERREYAAERDRAETALARSLAVAKEHVGDADEARALDAVSRSLADYGRERRDIEARELPPVAGYRAIQPTLDRATQAIDRFVDENYRQAVATQRNTVRWTRRIDLLVAVLAAVVVGIPLAALMALRALVIRPLLSLRAVVRQLGDGDRSARAALSGAEDVREIAGAFNEAADALDRQHGQQLQFLAGVAHDLRNPLSALKLIARPARREREREEGRAAGDIEALRALVARQVDRLDRMVGDLLDATRIEAGELDLQSASHDVREIVRATVALFAPASPRHEIVASLPESPLPLWCDAARIEQVLNNLLSNAIKYSPAGGRVEIEAGALGSDVLIAVRDQGVGISPADLPHIFEPFRRTLSARESVPGVGLGLSIARRIVQAHGGRLEVESVPDRGTTFTLRLPVTGTNERPALRTTRPLPEAHAAG